MSRADRGRGVHVPAPPQVLGALEVAGDGLLGPLELIRGTFSFLLSTPDDPRIDPAMGGGSLWDVGCYPVSFARRLAGEEPDRVAAFARLDERGVDRTFIGQLHFPEAAFFGPQFDEVTSGPVTRSPCQIVGQAGRLVLDSPFVPAPDGPRPVVTLWRGRVREQITVPSMDQYRAEVEDLTGAILDGTPPRVSLDFSRGTIATLVDLDLAARSTG